MEVYIDIFFCLIYISIRYTFPDCVMVAPQILVLIVGVRILLGELKLTLLVSSFFAGLYDMLAILLAASNIGLVRRPLKAKRRVRLP